MIGAGTDGDGDAEAQLCLCAALAIALAFLLPHAPTVLATSAPPRHAGCHHQLPLRLLEPVPDAKEVEFEEECKVTATAVHSELLLLAPLLEPQEGPLPLFTPHRQVGVGLAMARGGVYAFLPALGVVELSHNFGVWWKLFAVSLFLWERRWELLPGGGGIAATFLAKTREQWSLQDPGAFLTGVASPVSSAYSCLEAWRCERQELVATDAEESWPAGRLTGMAPLVVSSKESAAGGWREYSTTRQAACTPADEVHWKNGDNFEAEEERGSSPARRSRDKYVNCIAATVRLTKTEQGMDFDLHDFSGAPRRRHFVPLLVQAAGHQ